MSQITVRGYQILQDASVTLDGLVIQPVVLAEFHIDGRRQLHCMFQHPEDGEWKPVACFSEAVLNVKEEAFMNAMIELNFQIPDVTWN